MKPYINSLIIAIATLLGAFILSNTIKNRNRSNDTVSVTGLGSKNFVADLIVWNGNFEQKSMNLKEAYAQLDRDRENIRKYMLSKGLTAENIIFSSIKIEKQFEEVHDNNGTRIKSVFAGYKLNQEVQIESKEVEKVENISREISELINLGIEFYSNDPQYYYTKLAELKVEMIADATKDAYDRATKIALNAGSKTGRLKSAAMGVFQIVAQNSSEEYSWGGSYNTSSKRKTASITVKLDYELQ